MASTGTYLESPFHRYAHGKDLAELPLSSLAALEGVVIRAIHRSDRTIDDRLFEGLNLNGKAALVHTGGDRHWNTERYFAGHPFLTKGAAEYLAGAGAGLVGIDSLNIDDTADGTSPVHTILLGQEVPTSSISAGWSNCQIKGSSFSP